MQVPNDTTSMSADPTLTSGWSQAYEDHEDGMLWQEDPIPVLPDAVEVLHGRDVGTVVDLGCGDGRNILALDAAGFRTMGVDLSATALSRAREGLRGSGFLLQSDATSLPLIDGSVDAVTVLDVFGQFSDPTSLLAEIRRILVPGGTLILTAYTHGDSEYGVGEELVPHLFSYKDTVFRFYDEPTLREVLTGWDLQEFRAVRWDDPPHGSYRPYPHTHENWFVVATREDI